MKQQSQQDVEKCALWSRGERGRWHKPVAYKPVEKSDVQELLIGNKKMSPMFYQKIKSIEEIIESEEKKLDHFTKEYATADEAHIYLYEIFIDGSKRKLKALEKEKRKFERLRRLSLGKEEPSKPDNYIEADDVKHVPITELMETEGQKYGSRMKYLCPLHNEKTPSFNVFLEENRYHCFGCGEHGDVIELYMKMNNCQFIDALQALNRMN